MIITHSILFRKKLSNFHPTKSLFYVHLKVRLMIYTVTFSYGIKCYIDSFCYQQNKHLFNKTKKKSKKANSY